HTEDFVRLDEVKRRLNKVLEQIHRELRKGANGLTLEFCLPRELLCWPVDEWKVEVGLGTFSPAGIRYPVVVRFRDRAADYLVHPLWFQKWDHFQPPKPSPVVPILWVHHPAEFQPQDIYTRLLGSDDLVCLGLGFMPPTSCPRTEDDVLL